MTCQCAAPAAVAGLPGVLGRRSERLAAEAGKAGRQAERVAGGPGERGEDARQAAGGLPGWAAGARPELEGGW